MKALWEMRGVMDLTHSPYLLDISVGGRAQELVEDVLGSEALLDDAGDWSSEIGNFAERLRNDLFWRSLIYGLSDNVANL